MMVMFGSAVQLTEAFIGENGSAENRHVMSSHANTVQRGAHPPAPERNRRGKNNEFASNQAILGVAS
jgi:hypothetical protein